jgi:hypothetical protein
MRCAIGVKSELCVMRCLTATVKAIKTTFACLSAEPTAAQRRQTSIALALIPSPQRIQQLTIQPNIPYPSSLAAAQLRVRVRSTSIHSSATALQHSNARNGTHRLLRRRVLLHTRWRLLVVSWLRCLVRHIVLW